MPIDPRELAAMSGVRPGAGAPGFDVPRCPKCGYSRAGLMPEALCPECGTPPRKKPRSGPKDNLIDAPLVYLKNLGLGFALMALGMMISVCCLFPVWGAGLQERALTGLFASTFWLCGVLIVTAPRRSAVISYDETRRERSRLRLTNRLSQVGWLVYWGAAAYLSMTQPGPGTLLKVVAGFGTASLFVGLAGLPLLCVQITDLSDWASDDTMTDRWRAAAWLITIGGAVSLLGPVFGQILPFARALLWLLEFMLQGLLGVGVILFVICAVQMIRLVSWARRNADAISGRDERMRARAAAAEEERRVNDERIRDELARRDALQAGVSRRAPVATAASPGAAARASRPALDRPEPGSRTHRIAEATERGYDIEP